MGFMSGREVVVVAVITLLVAAGSQLPKLIWTIRGAPERRGDGGSTRPDGRRDAG